jgi:glucose/arabinose dehydrogenase
MLGGVTVRRVLLGLVLVLAVVGVIGYLVAGRAVNMSGQVGSGGEVALTVPDGYVAEVFATGLDEPRLAQFGPDGVLYVAERDRARIVALPDADGDGRADAPRVLADGLEGVHSVAFHEGSWYAGVPSGVVRLTDDDGDGAAEQRDVVVDDIPSDGNHTTRTVAFLPDGRMVLSVGSSCNVCQEQDPRRAAIVVYDGPDGGGEQLFATGLRNAIGLTLSPDDGALWASNNGRDLLGDDYPPEAVYRVEEGADHGWPSCVNGVDEDPDEGTPGACDGVARPQAELQAHSAPMALTFYEGDLIVALHGSWNRSELAGYEVVRLPFADGAPTGAVEPFASGWLDGDTVHGRPVGLAVGPDGALYVTDDKAGLVYRVRPEG